MLDVEKENGLGFTVVVELSEGIGAGSVYVVNVVDCVFLIKSFLVYVESKIYCRRKFL